jgi:hypothetical protein
LFNDYNNFEDNITQSKSNNKKKYNNIKKNNITAPLKNKKLQRKIKQNSFLNSNNIKSKIENLKRPKASLKNSNIFNTNQKRTRNSNKYENTLYNNIDSKNRISQEQYNLTNQGNYNSHYNTNYNTNYNTTSSNYIRETNPSMSKEKYLNTYSSNEQNNNINNKYYNTSNDIFNTINGQKKSDNGINGLNGYNGYIGFNGQNEYSGLKSNIYKDQIINPKNNYSQTSQRLNKSNGRKKFNADEYFEKLKMELKENRKSDNDDIDNINVYLNKEYNFIKEMKEGLNEYK